MEYVVIPRSQTKINSPQRCSGAHHKHMQPNRRTTRRRLLWPSQTASWRVSAEVAGCATVCLELGEQCGSHSILHAMSEFDPSTGIPDCRLRELKIRCRYGWPLSVDRTPIGKHQSHPTLQIALTPPQRRNRSARSQSRRWHRRQDELRPLTGRPCGCVPTEGGLLRDFRFYTASPALGRCGGVRRCPVGLTWEKKCKIRS